MKKFIIPMILAAFLMFGACGEKAKELKEIAKIAKDAPKKAKQMEEKMSRAEKIREKRRERGDTTAMHYKKLQDMLPQSLPGYEGPELSGESVNMGRFSMSNASAEFTKETDNGRSRINIKLVDYNENYGMLAGMTTWLDGYSRENDQGYERTFDCGIKDAFAMEKYRNERERAELTYYVGYRFLLTITGTKQKDTKFLKKAADQMPLKKMSNM